MENNRNLILAMVLSVGVLFAWQALIVAPRMERERKAAEIEASRNPVKPAGQDATVPQAKGNADPSTAPVPGGVATPTGADESKTREAAVKEARRVPLKSGLLEGSINLRGARIDDLHLLNYHETVDKGSPTIVLLSPAGTRDAYFAEFGWAVNEKAGELPGPKTEWRLKSGKALSPSSPLMLEWQNDKGLSFTRTIELDDKYMFTVKDSVQNSGGEALALEPYGRVARFGEPKVEGIYVLHEGLIGSVGEQGLDEIDYDDIKEDKQITKEKAAKGWLGITDKYWATALIPGTPFTAHYNYYNQGRSLYQADFLGEVLAVPANGAAEVSQRLFAGAKKVDIIDGYEESLNIPLFSNLIDWGWFYFLTKPLFAALDWIYKLIGNFGVAILIVTVLIKIVFFPLANKSYVSMANMKKVQPKMQEIKERHGDDRQAQQKAMMELYKEEKINPASGCWPMLIQIPVFFALYKVLYVTIEMRHAPFFGWINDLSAPDPTSLFNLFGLLPYDVPLFLTIGVWPLLMGITMFLQMRMNPTPPDPTQAMIFTWMPVIFTFMLATFPAGLVIYWAWNNFLSIIQQGTIMKRQGAKIELWDNLKELLQKKPKVEPGE